MPTNFADPHQRLLAHYIRLAQTEGWGLYTRIRLETLAREPMYSDFPQLVKDAVAVLPAPSSSPTAETENPIPPA